MSMLFKCRACGGRYWDVQNDGSVYHHVCGPLPADKKNPERERHNKRDENIARHRDRGVTGIVSEGAGVTCLASSQLEEPLWISALYKRIEAEEAKRNA